MHDLSDLYPMLSVKRSHLFDTFNTLMAIFMLTDDRRTKLIVISLVHACLMTQSTTGLFYTQALHYTLRQVALYRLYNLYLQQFTVLKGLLSYIYVAVTILTRVLLSTYPACVYCTLRWRSVYVYDLMTLTCTKLEHAQ